MTSFHARLAWIFVRVGAATVVLACLLVACSPAGGPLIHAGTAEAQGGMGALSGTVTLRPLTPAERPGTPSSAPAPGVRIVVSGPDAREIQSTLTDAAGLYRMSLPPGSYQVAVPELPIPQFTKDLPATVSIAGGQESRLDIQIDTGLRAR